jgi:predicted PurR-regulated permease PerM
MGRAIKVPDLVTVVAALLGGVLLGVVGALVAIPVAAAVLLILQEVTFPRLDRA